MVDFRGRYGEWAIVTGASSGIGEAFAHAVAARGVKPLLVARRPDELARVAADVQRLSGLPCETAALDLADPGFVDALVKACAGKEVGLVVGNAAYNPAGAFLDMSRETLTRMVDVNARANLLLANAFVPLLKDRGKGGFLMVGSVEGFVGVPYSTCYAATKAFLLSFGEGLWGECVEFGVDVLVVTPGATDTPLLASRDLGAGKVPAMRPQAVAEIALDNLSRGPVVVPGEKNRDWIATLLKSPRREAVLNWAKMMRPITEASVRKAGGR